MGFTIQQESARVKAACHFQVNAELKEIELLDCSASVAESLQGATGELRLGMRLDPMVLKAEPGRARFAVRIKVFGDRKEAGTGEDRKHLIEVACRYALGYSLSEGYVPSEQELDAFKEGNAVFHCWPYFREFVHNLTMRMSLQLPPLPLLRLAPKIESKKAPVKRARPARKSSAGDNPSIES